MKFLLIVKNVGQSHKQTSSFSLRRDFVCSVHTGAFEQQTLCRKKRGWKVLGTLESLFASTMHIDDSHLFTEYVAFSLLCLLNVAGLGNDACVS